MNKITDANVRGLIKHYDRMAKMKGTVNYDLVARLLRELLELRAALNGAGQR